VYFPDIPCLALSALALSRRFSGFRSLWPFEFISPRSALGFLLQSFLLREIGCFFLRDFVAFRSSFRLLSLAATRSCSRVGRLNPVLSTTLQFDFRGFYPLAARSVGSMVSRLQWSMLSWFFNPLQGICLFVLRAPYLDLDRCSTSATSPALTVYNRLSDACASVYLCWLVPRYVSSPRFFFCAFCVTCLSVVFTIHSQALFARRFWRSLYS